ncbi:MAG: AraC family transcriptional regulator [Saccharofermentanaceae bacterium]|jgi:YesN/AraC family two-component response regulator|nr:AraC family transcriptional regulator [Clostridiaceae bacterium]
MSIDKELETQLLYERENTDGRISYGLEISYYDMIAKGDWDSLLAFQAQIGEKSHHRHGVLSTNALTNKKYHTIIMTALISRFCIEAGMEVTLSYSISDIYIRRIDQAKSIEELSQLSLEIAREYCKRMRELNRNKAVSRHVVLSIDYIRSHIQENLSVEIIADSLCLNPSYLSKLFKKEMDCSISDYIRKAKINVASNMLRHLDEPSLSISNYLGFSSQSHFIQVFKKSTGYTPEEYRKKYYHQSLLVNDSLDNDD